MPFPMPPASIIAHSRALNPFSLSARSLSISPHAFRFGLSGYPLANSFTPSCQSSLMWAKEILCESYPPPLYCAAAALRASLSISGEDEDAYLVLACLDFVFSFFPFPLFPLLPLALDYFLFALACELSLSYTDRAANV